MKITFQALKARFFSSKTESGNKMSLEDMDILDHIEKIVELSKKEGIERCLSRGKAHLDYIVEKLGVTPLQGILFSHFMERSADNHILISEIAESIQCSKVRIIKYMNECEALEQKKLIRCSRNRDRISFRVPRDVRDSLRKFNEFRPENKENLSIFKFFSLLDDLFEERSDDELSFESLKTELEDLIRLNMHLEFCRRIMSYNLYEDHVALLVCFCHLYVNNSDDNIGFHDFAFLYDDKGEANEIKKLFSNGAHRLIKIKFIENNNNGGFVNSESWKLSGMAKKELLPEVSDQENQNYEKNLTLYDSIKPKKMFYNQRESEEIKTLVSLLSEDNYVKIQERLNHKGMRNGFACLFSGGPGTGKTETAYQIARETKRNLMMVDISQTKSMWYGESEKNIRRIFDEYRAAVGGSAVAPILLFNEADAIIGKRKEFNGSSRAVDQTDNTIQNIILEEMENLSGILIATTNLTQNMDNAFERRFLYKINFDKPTAESRVNIWKALIGDLPDDYAEELAAKFDLTGGQIENIARKAAVDAILNGDDLSIDRITGYCKDEIESGFNFAKRIGFNS